MAQKVELTNQQLQALLDGFRNCKVLDDSPEKLKGIVREIRDELLSPDRLRALDDDALAKKAAVIYKGTVAVPLYAQTLVRYPQRLREGLEYLGSLGPSTQIESTVDQFLTPTGRFNIPGIGKAFWSTFFMAVDPQQHPSWNNKTERALADMGLAGWSRSDSPGVVYARIAAAMQRLLRLAPWATLYQMDYFMHYVTIMDGAGMIRQWRSGDQQGSDEGLEKFRPFVEETRARHIPARRITVRQESEAEARHLLETKLGMFTEEDLSTFGTLINTDFYTDRLGTQRFGLAFTGRASSPGESAGPFLSRAMTSWHLGASWTWPRR